MQNLKKEFIICAIELKATWKKEALIVGGQAEATQSRLNHSAKRQDWNIVATELTHNRKKTYPPLSVKTESRPVNRSMADHQNGMK